MRPIRIIRAREWWQHKLAPVLAVAYGTARLGHISLASRAVETVTLLAAIAVAATFTSLLNDATDRRDDAVSGKVNRLSDRSSRSIALMIAATIVAGAAFVALWRHDGRAVAAYAGSWVCFTLYSLPPIRFKRRGVAGAICDAGGAHVFPALLAIALFDAPAVNPLRTEWTVAVAVWALTYGLRGILWHQIGDVGNDRDGGVRTAVVAIGESNATRLAHFVLFPIELIALAVMLLLLRSWWAVGAAALYAIFALARTARRGVVMVVAAPRAAPFAIVLHEYYEWFLPLALVAESSLVHPTDAWFAAAHVVLFAGRTRAIASDVFDLARPREVRRT